MIEDAKHSKKSASPYFSFYSNKWFKIDGFFLSDRKCDQANWELEKCSVFTLSLMGKEY